MEFQNFPENSHSSRPANAKRPHLILRAAIEMLDGAMSGFVLDKQEVDCAMEDIALAVTDASLPMLEIDEQLSVLSGRIPAKLFDTISEIIGNFRSLVDAGTGVQLRYVLSSVSNGNIL